MINLSAISSPFFFFLKVGSMPNVEALCGALTPNPEIKSWPSN